MSMVTVQSVLPESVLTADAVQRKFQGHHRPQTYVGERSGRYNYGLAGMDGMDGMDGTHYGYEIASRRGRFFARGMAGLSALGQTCDDTGNCYDDSGTFIGTMDPSGSGPFNPIPGYDGPIPIITVAAQPPVAQTPGGPLYTSVPDGTQQVQAGSTVNTPSGPVAVPPANASQAQLNQFWATIAAAGIDVAKLAIIQPGTSQAGGSITRQNPGYAVQPIATSTHTGISANVSTGAAVAGSTVAIIGLGLVALMLMSRRH